jgi:hypothetical protein
MGPSIELRCAGKTGRPFMVKEYDPRLCGGVRPRDRKGSGQDRTLLARIAGDPVFPELAKQLFGGKSLGSACDWQPVYSR